MGQNERVIVQSIAGALVLFTTLFIVAGYLHLL
jgi:hypothetical protein